MKRVFLEGLSRLDRIKTLLRRVIALSLYIYILYHWRFLIQYTGRGTEPKKKETTETVLSLRVGVRVEEFLLCTALGRATLTGRLIDSETER